MTQRDFAGKVVLITGAAGGLGRALARSFAADGARIAVLDRDASGAEALAAELRSQARHALSLACDVTDAAACERAAAVVIEAWGAIDVLINNAGITHRSAYRRTDPAVTRRVMEVNFFGAVNCTRAALAALTESRGLIIVVSSVAGFAPLIARTGYAAAKHALHGFFDSLRTELAEDGVGVLLVCPLLYRHRHRQERARRRRPAGAPQPADRGLARAPGCGCRRGAACSQERQAPAAARAHGETRLVGEPARAALLRAGHGAAAARGDVRGVARIGASGPRRPRFAAITCSGRSLHP